MHKIIFCRSNIKILFGNVDIKNNKYFPGILVKSYKLHLKKYMSIIKQYSQNDIIKWNNSILLCIIQFREKNNIIFF